MCSTHRIKFCLTCLCVYMLSWIPVYTHAENTTHPLTLHDENTTSQFHGHKHFHDHDYHEIPAENRSAEENEGRELELFFVRQIFDKYGKNNTLTISGIEKMLKNLGFKFLDDKDHDHNHIGEADSSATHQDFMMYDKLHVADPDFNNSGTQSHDHKHSDDHDSHDHDSHDHDSHDHDSHDHDSPDHDSPDHDSHDHDSHDHDSHDHDSHDSHDHDSHDHSGENKSKTSVCNISAIKLMQSFDADHVQEIYSKCIGEPHGLLSLYELNERSTISPQDFVNLSPGLLVLLDNWHKRETSHDHSHSDHNHGNINKGYNSVGEIPASVWGYSCAAVIAVSLTGLAAVAVVPVMQKVFFNHLLQFLVALAVGALSGDALLHLLPHAFEEQLHGSHGEENGNHSDEKKGVYKGLSALAGVFLFFLMERLLTIFTNFKRKEKKKSRHSRHSDIHLESNPNDSSLHSPAMDAPDCETRMLGIHPANRALENYAKESHQGNCELLNGSTDVENHNTQSMLHSEDQEDSTVLSFSHGHSHGCKKVPKTVASIAWMVILGDGIHNFSDGLAIGAAFADSITGGISTSIAIFFHELPHELGDFAVLLRAGMTWKQALVYNMVSSGLAFFGMLIGVMIGNIASASLWVFSVVGGIFLYISLVDMLPEMTALDTRKGENPFYHLFLQSFGILVGSGIMFTVAIYEHDLMNVLES